MKILSKINDFIKKDYKSANLNAGFMINPYSFGVVEAGATRGLFAGGYTPTRVNVIDYITIATTGNATDFGDLTVARYFVAGCASATRGLFGGGVSSNVIDYVTIATTGNAIDFGDLTVTRSGLAGLASTTRGVFGGDDSYTTVIDYVTIATTGNATDFGDLTVARTYLAGCAGA